MKKHRGGENGGTLIALVEDKPGVLNRVASLFRRRANIRVWPWGTRQPGVSH